MKNYIISFFFTMILSAFLTSVVAQPIMNEIYSRGSAGNLDWIEIYNSGSTQFDISGYKIYDIGGQSGTKPKKIFPAGTILPPHGFYVVITDTADYPGDQSAFGLSASGETVWLEDTLGVIVDSVAFPAMNVTQTYGRLPDGGEWQLLNVITRGASNVANVTLSVKLNEVFSRGTASDPDWIEVYNTSSSDVDISGYKIYDNGGQSGSKPKKLFPSGSIIPSNGFLVIVTDDGDSSAFGLSNSGEKVWLENNASIVIDSVDFPALQANQTYIRYPDGAENWVKTDSITKGSANIYYIISAIKMNEIYSRGTASAPDWIEIYNTSSSPVDLTGVKIYDNGGFNGTKPKKQFPDGTVIPANGFYVIVTDDTTESGFGLSNSGEEVWLEDASDNVIDNVVFPAMDATQSYGRIPDGGNWMLSNNITKGYSNNPIKVDEDPMITKEYQLFQNYPNPFNPVSNIQYAVGKPSFVSLKVYDVLGKEIATLVDEEKEAGIYNVKFSVGQSAIGGSSPNIASGIYFYRIKAGSFSQTRKMILMK